MTGPAAKQRSKATAAPHEVDELLYESDRTRVVRRRREQADAVILKQALGADAKRRLGQEAAILQRLQHVEGVVKLAPVTTAVDTLALADDQGIPLSKCVAAAAAWTPAELVDLAGGLARILSGVHQAGVVHKDINPSNVLVRGPQRTLILIDFNFASTLAEELPAFAHQSHLAGTLAYMSPEQTGRTGRAVDKRTDLYALGVTLYELATGRRPFESDDVLELVHAHLVQLPTAPVALQPRLPPALSDIILRLLEKEPDRRYQSAEGLAADLAALRAALCGGDTSPLVLGRNDFAARLLPPSRLIGRAAEVAVLRTAVERCITGTGTAGLLVAGAPGVGKTALIGELRPLAAAHRGWFMSCKFDQYRQDAPTAVLEPLRALGRLLLAEPEDRLAAHRQRILDGLGSNLGLGPSLLPEFALLLGPHPRVEVADPLEAEARMIQATLDLMRSTASAERPVIVVYDDVQWAPPIALRLLDAVFTASERIPGLLLVGVYRANEVDRAHPLSVCLQRWRELGTAPLQLTLSNLPQADAATLIGEMLRMPAEQAAALGAALQERTDGNPYDSVELVNALRQADVLVRRDGYWEWSTRAVHEYVGDASVVELLRRRVARLPAQTCAVLETMACLGGEVRPALLQASCSMDSDALQRHLAPALEEGLLVAEQGNEIALRFRHDRVQQAVFEGMDPASRRERHLALGRRLTGRPEFGATAAEQYLAAVEGLSDEAECRRVAGLFQQAAGRLRALNFVVSERFLAAAIGLLTAVETHADAAWMAALQSERHQALYGMGRLEEADHVYAAIVARCSDPMQLVEPAGVQMYSLANRNRYVESMELGLQLLAQLGLARPPDPRAAIGEGIGRLIEWHRGPDRLRDFTCPLVSDPLVLAWAKLIIKTANGAYFCDPMTFGWLVLSAHRLWVEHGPCAQLMPSVGLVPFLLVGTPQDYPGAYAAARHVVAVGEARGFEPGTSVARCWFAVGAAHWVEPIEQTVQSYHQAREGLVRAGDFGFAAYTYRAGDVLLDCSENLDVASAEIEAGIAFAARTGNAAYTQRYLPFRQLIRALRGETQAPGSFTDASFDEPSYVASLEHPSATSVTYHVVRMMSAAVFGDIATLAEHARSAVPALGRTPGYYSTALARVLHGVALCEQARALPAPQRGPVLDELDRNCLAWIAARAADAPLNFRHLQRWLEAERAWADDALWTAGAAFDAAIEAAEEPLRPWHRALITERAGLFHLAHGLDTSGRRLLAHACTLYEAWGAPGKVRELHRVHAFLRPGPALRLADATERSGTLTTEVVDLMAVLRASQALSSETTLARLTERVGMVLSAMTGATSVQLLVRRDRSDGWFVAAANDDGAEAVTVAQAGAAGDLPLAVFRYAERTGEVLLLDDATADDRFAADPYLAGLERCSMLWVPIVKQGEMRALLVLESRHLRAAFTAERIDCVALIAGQLAVSLDNALLYDSLERKVAERTVALEDANQRLELLSLTDALTGLPNRRHFNASLEAEWQRASRTQRPLGLAMIDIDFFKLYNDHHGHLSGDACLRRVAATLNTGRRGGSDLVARYGGEEFVLLLPDTDLEGTLQVADRVRAAVEALGQPHPPSTHRIVTISAGVAAATPNPAMLPAQLVAAADAALYTAKREGRNRVARGA